MKKFTVITDPGIDDMISLMLLHRLDKKAKNIVLSTFGNAPESITSQNAKEFVSFVAPHWQFKHGSTLPYSGKVERPWPDYFHGPDGVWNIHPQTKISQTPEHVTVPKNNDVISLATLTDVQLLNKLKAFQNITIMGGVFHEEGNETLYAETNIAFDPDAAHYFFKEVKDVSVNVVPLDVTRKVFWTIEKVNEIPETTEQNIWLKKMLHAWFNNYNHEREKNFTLHDPLAVFVTFFPDEVIWEKSGVEVVIKGERRGQTVLSKESGPCSIALTIPDPDTISQKIFELVFLG